MLVLKRRIGERVRIKVGKVLVWVQVLDAPHGGLRLGISAPPEVEIMREEIIPKDHELGGEG